jgi:hypothetical protein
MESRFYIADDIQVLQGGKLAMIGVSADAVLVVQQKGLLSKKTKRSPTPSLPRLCMLVNVVGLPKLRHSIVPQIYYPSGTSAPGLQAMPLDLEQRRSDSANVLLRFEPFPMPEFGIYKLSWTIENQTLEHFFEIRLDVSEAQGPPIVPTARSPAAKSPASTSSRKRAQGN